MTPILRSIPTMLTDVTPQMTILQEENFRAAAAGDDL